jgi:hypothetical protein
LSIVAYDAEAKVYTYYGIRSFGGSDSDKMTLTGNTWTSLWEGRAAGKPAKFRYTEVQVSPTS